MQALVLPNCAATAIGAFVFGNEFEQHALCCKQKY